VIDFATVSKTPITTHQRSPYDHALPENFT
jgi:hypothetical protein